MSEERRIAAALIALGMGAAKAPKTYAMVRFAGAAREAVVVERAQREQMSAKVLYCRA